MLFTNRVNDSHDMLTDTLCLFFLWAIFEMDKGGLPAFGTVWQILSAQPETEFIFEGNWSEDRAVDNNNSNNNEQLY